MRRVPVLPNENALPGAEIQPASIHRQIEPGLREHAAHVGRHVVGPFRRMPEHGVAVGNKPRHESFEIAEHRGVRVLAQHQRGAGVMNEHVAEPLFNAGGLHRARHLSGDLIGTATARADLNRALFQHSGGVGYGKLDGLSMPERIMD